MKTYTLKLIDELGNVYYTIEEADYKKMRKIVSTWRKERRNIKIEGEPTVFKCPNGEELWVYET